MLQASPIKPHYSLVPRLSQHGVQSGDIRIVVLQECLCPNKLISGTTQAALEQRHEC